MSDIVVTAIVGGMYAIWIVMVILIMKGKL